MAKGENIFKRKDGRWEARYIKGYELSGKIKYGFCYGKTYKEAKKKSPEPRRRCSAENPLRNLTLGIGLHFFVTNGLNQVKTVSKNLHV